MGFSRRRGRDKRKRKRRRKQSLQKTKIVSKNIGLEVGAGMGQAFLLDGGLSYLIARRKGASSARAFNLASKRLRSAVPYVAAGGLGIGAYRGFRQVRSK